MKNQILGLSPAATASAQGTLEDYNRAYALRHQFSADSVFHWARSSAWCDSTHVLHYQISTPQGRKFVSYDADKDERKTYDSQEAMEKALKGKATLLYAQGSNIWRNRELQKNGEQGKPITWGDEVKMKNEALQIAKEADVIICAMGETADMSGECASRTNLEMPDVQQELLAELAKMGKPVVLLNFAGRPTVLSWENTYLPS